MHNCLTIYYTAIYYTAPTCFDIIMPSSIEILNCISKTAFTYFRYLAGTDYELPEDDTLVSKHVGAV